VKTLRQYEDELITNVNAITLLGQLGYDETDLAALRTALRPFFAPSPQAGLRTVGDRYPLAFALYLILEGLYHYTGGDYWSSPREAIGLNTYALREHAGSLFRIALRAHDLPTFEQLGGHVNVTPILAHGGIPNYCLDDYFDLLDRVARRDTVVDVPTLMDEWAAGGVGHNIDKPAQRFLLYGGDMAEEFVGRCLALWLEPDVDPLSLDLPQRVLDRYESWRDARGPRAGGRRAVHLSRPRLTFDPYGEGVALILPPIRCAPDQAPTAVTWLIEAGQRQRKEETDCRRLNDGVEFAAYAPVVNVQTIAPDYRITALADDRPIQSWTLRGPDAPPLLAFDPDTGELLLDRHAAGESQSDYWLSPGERWLIFPRGWSAAPNGARKLVELPELDGEWSRFTVETWRLEPDGRLELNAPGGEGAAFRARNDPPPARPVLDDPALIAPGAHERFALYNGRPPTLCIPPGRTEHQPAKWRIEIVPTGPADPPASRAYRLSDLAQHCIIVDGNLLLSLDAPQLLGRAPFGEFQIRLRGPYGRKAVFDVRFAPGLRFEDYPRLSLSTDDAPTRFRISHAAGFELLPDDSGIEVAPIVAAHPDEPAYDVTIAPEKTRVPLVLRGPHGAMAFDLPVYRARLGLVEPERPDAFRWSTTPLRLHPATLDAPHTAMIRVDLPLPPGEPPRRAGWRLVDRSGRPLREQPPRPVMRHPQTNLVEWLDAFHHEGSTAVLQLVVIDDAAGTETVIDAARLLPTLELGHVETVWQINDSGGRLSLHWETAALVRNRQLRLWPEDRPWATSPIIVPVPDEADDWAEWNLTADRLPPGDYLAEMVIDDPWDPSQPNRPTPGAANTFLLRPDDAVAALADALARATHDRMTADEALSWVLWLARTRFDNTVARFNIILWRERSSLSTTQLTLWADAARAIDEGSAYQIAQKALYENGFLDRLQSLSAEERSAYLAHLPDTLEADTYHALLPLATGEPRHKCLAALCRVGDEVAFRVLLADAPADHTADRALWCESAVKLLLLSPQQAIDFLCETDSDTAAELLYLLLSRFHCEYVVIKGTELETNAGIVRVTGIKRLDTKTDAAFHRIGDDTSYLLGRLWPETSDLPLEINPAQQTIRILKSPVYSCQFSGRPQCDNVFATRKELKLHHRRVHKMDDSRAEEKNLLTLALTHLSIRHE